MVVGVYNGNIHSAGTATFPMGEENVSRALNLIAVKYYEKVRKSWNYVEESILLQRYNPDGDLRPWPGHDLMPPL